MGHLRSSGGGSGFEVGTSMRVVRALECRLERSSEIVFMFLIKLMIMIIISFRVSVRVIIRNF